jgi:hypothetical protein
MKLWYVAVKMFDHVVYMQVKHKLDRQPTKFSEEDSVAMVHLIDDELEAFVVGID